MRLKSTWNNKMKFWVGTGSAVLAMALIAIACKPRITSYRSAAGSSEGVKPGTRGENSEHPGSSTGQSEETSANSDVCANIVKADVVAIDQPYTYNRFGSFNPVGMMYALRRDVVAIDAGRPVGPGNVRLRPDKRPRPMVLRVNEGDCLEIKFTNLLAPKRADISDAIINGVFNIEQGEAHENDSPITRVASIHVNGLSYLNIGADGANVGRNPSSLVAPGQSFTYKLYGEKEGTYFMHSAGAVVGGEGDGGQIVQGLFGAVNVEPRGAKWYRSQVTKEVLAAATIGMNPDGSPKLNYDAADAKGVPLLSMTNASNEIMHTDINAIITGYTSSSTSGTPSSKERGFFREFTVIFHDETKTIQAYNELNTHMLEGVKDGFGINYGVAGAGAMVLANRKKVGPTKNCADCRLEEFFLESWAGGDPALNVRKNSEGVAVEALFPDDPSNVHHSYVGDPVRFRNLHAGPKEHHVFHLHAHQWLRAPNNPNSIYLDSQTIGPQGAYTYDINYNGAGNRNLMVGDSIFHCHLYPHFAMGMWELWRHHDTFEDGSPQRNLPDGEIVAGTPTPAVIPIPALPMAPQPTYSPTVATNSSGTTATRPAHPGYPHYIAAKSGFRSSQAPLDIRHDGGMPRHLALGAPNEPGAVLSGFNGDPGTHGLLDVQVKKAHIKLLPQDGTPAEKNAMSFHGGTFPFAQSVTNAYGWAAKGYPAYNALGQSGLFLVNGRPPAPGAPFADPCPANAPQRSYRGVYVQTNLVATKSGWHDPQARFIVLNEDYDATLSGARAPEPFFMRANSGDCVTFYASNAIPEALQQDDFQIYTPTDTIGQHIHLVKFDVTASDGSGNGFNYEDGTFSYEEVVHKIEAANAAGGAYEADGALGITGNRQMLTPVANPWLSGSAPVGVQTTTQRWWVDPLVNEKGFDRTIGTVFTHDHFGPSSHQHHGFYAALVIEPKDSVWKDQSTGVVMGTRADGGPTSWKADIITGAGGSGSYREFNLALSDFALLYDGDRPVVPPKQEVLGLPHIVGFPKGAPTPEVISISDPGMSLLNYRAEPLPDRVGQPSAGPGSQYVLKASSQARNPAFVFSSTVHGDPFTPILRGYEGDRVKVRWIIGGQEETHGVTISGHTWNREVDDPDSGLAAAQNMGLSEHFEFDLSNGLTAFKNPRGTADYYVGATSTDDIWGGAWGLLRAYDHQKSDLRPLPNNPVPNIPPRPINACPLGSKAREYNVVAITARGNLPGNRLVYNKKYDLYDDDAILYVREEHVAGLRNGTRRAEPLILRAAAGECVRVTLKNQLPEILPKKPHWNFYQPITEKFNVNHIPMSSWVGLQPQLVTYDVNRSDGTAMGYNENSLVAPGKQRVYEWYAGQYKLDALRVSEKRVSRPIEFGVVNLRGMGDVINHPSKGAGGGVLIIEPSGATWTADATSEAQATVKYMEAGKQSQFRELVNVYFDEGGVFTGRQEFAGQSFPAVPNTGQPSGPDEGHAGEPAEIDAEDAGFKGFNLTSEPLWARMGLPPSSAPDEANNIQQGNLFSSAAHGDPETPLFTAKMGIPLRMRVGAPSTHTRNHTFTWHGHMWYRNPFKQGSASSVMGYNPLSPVHANIDGVTAGGHYNILPLHPAGGRFKVAGDYMYRDGPSNSLLSGQWGIVRVEP